MFVESESVFTLVGFYAIYTESGNILMENSHFLYSIVAKNKRQDTTCVALGTVIQIWRICEKSLMCVTDFFGGANK